MLYVFALFLVLIVLVLYYLYNNDVIQINLGKKEQMKDTPKSKVKPSGGDHQSVEGGASAGGNRSVEGNQSVEGNLTIEGKVPPSAVMFGRKSPATCDFDNSTVMKSRLQPEDRTFDYRMAKRMKQTQQNQYRQQYAQARNNADKFRFIWAAELDEQERRQWMNQPAGAIRLSKYDDY